MNIFDYHQDNSADNEELLTTLFKQNNVEIERIVSQGQTTPIDQPYEQNQDEFVIILQGKACLWIESKGICSLKEGDYIFINAYDKHRVTYSSVNPPTIWLAVHIY